MTTLILVSRYVIQSTGLALLLEKEFSSARILHFESLTHLKNTDPDLVPNILIIGVSHANTQNLNIIKRTKKEFHSSKIIVFDEDVEAGSTDYGNVWHFLRAGANGYITKLNNVSDLVACVADVMMEKRYISNHVFAHTAEKPDLPKPAKTIGILSSRESEIAGYLLEGMSTTLIAQKLERKASTISTIKNSVYKKMGVDSVIKLKEKLDQLELIATMQTVD